MSNENEYLPEEPIEEEIGNDETDADLNVLSTQMVRLQDELNGTKEQLLRTMADFQNFRKRNQNEVAQLRQFATENFVTALLPVLDNFERTVTHLQQGATAEQALVGIQAVERQLRAVLEGQNVRRIEAIGTPFDPEVHEAIGMEPSTEHPAGTVVVEAEPGYKMGDRIIRPARVKVATGS
ncbi:Heat shock protein GrpE [Fimbriimonas ginsengisoli Gsoil 348]|uniref:Protein GrpE n=1 Tax=Fimbriimonas ginsengisoli Gsoil 348 TaxID=661478 RepID=A0A068NWB9_FIMGI|nr:Heat shock protein GrpE [Fimbriimonas ginsengisoli Gsoil 348]